MPPIVRRAQPDELDQVIDILAECSAWLIAQGIVQWPDRFSPADLVPDLEDGDLYVVPDGSSLVATVTLQWTDRMFWGARGDAGFVHRLGVRRSHAGIGGSIMEWASTEVPSRGRYYLCLDCLCTNVRLRQYYEELGFTVVGAVNGPTEHAHTIAHGPWQAILYEQGIMAT
jgi:hypothetical protein